MGTFILILIIIILWTSISVATYMKKKTEAGKLDYDSKIILKIVCGVCGPSFMVAYIGDTILKSIIPDDLEPKGESHGRIERYKSL